MGKVLEFPVQRTVRLLEEQLETKSFYDPGVAQAQLYRNLDAYGLEVRARVLGALERHGIDTGIHVEDDIDWADVPVLDSLCAVYLHELMPVALAKENDLTYASALLEAVQCSVSNRIVMIRDGAPDEQTRAGYLSCSCDMLADLLEALEDSKR